MTDAPLRSDERDQFLRDAGWADAKIVTLKGDASTRSYARLTRNDQTAILMDAPNRLEKSACPQDATHEERRALGYNAEARLAGPNLNAFIQIAKALSKAGFSSPSIIHSDADVGFLLLEDLGDDLYTTAIAHGADENLLYEAAIDCLVDLHASSFQVPQSDEFCLLSYDTVALKRETKLLTDFYVKHTQGHDPSPDLVDQLDAQWNHVIELLPEPSVMVLRDYHAENLLWLPERTGIKRVGLLDFQDGLVGHPAYDLVSLLEDARRDVASDLASAMLDRYIEKARNSISGFDAEQFKRDYAILGAQRNAKILGIFARLIDQDNKPKYSPFLPRVRGHFRQNLAHPSLSGVREVIPHLSPSLLSVDSKSP
ncbi:MAG: phosphotransferase [Pseudomonadota bacterium]